MKAPTQLDNALWALQRGFKVFPLKKASKAPNGLLVPDGVLQSTTDETQVRKWWSEWPNGNVGINGGTIVDCDKGISSLDEAEAWREAVGLPPTLAVRTGRRSSYGIQYHCTGQTKTSPYEFQGVSGEVRSGNAYGIGPGSVHPDTGQIYEVVIDLPRAAYPLDCKLEQSKTKTAKKLAQDPSKLESGEKIKRSFRQYWLVSQCGRLRRTGLSGDALFAALRALRDQYCESPEEKTDAVLRQICESGEKNYGVHVPAAVEEIATPTELILPDMPEGVLDGRLGEIYQKRMKDFPRAFGWPALLAAGGTLIRPNGSVLRGNLYVALVSEPGAGKTSAINQANHVLDIRPPLLQSVKAGSAEGLAKKLGNSNGGRVLLFPDELSHLLEKAQIVNASFAYILNSLFYHDEDTLTVFHGKEVGLNCRLSLIGGLVTKKFDDAFASGTTAGLYDRFLFGQCPTGYEYLWRPIEGKAEITDEFDEVPIDHDVWQARDEVKKREGLNPRVLEIALRCAHICAALDGRQSLRTKDLGPAWELARYQTHVRMLLKPNPGKNHEAQVAIKILNYLESNPGFLKLRDVLANTRAYDYGPALCERVITALVCGGNVEHQEMKSARGRKIRLIRRVGAEE